ncbi:MAG: FHA domain-containing protein [Deltaproteobacteria bacterium]|nr:FHA domain-containing protein [Deltaproteobacteria bacterium]
MSQPSRTDGRDLPSPEAGEPDDDNDGVGTLVDRQMLRRLSGPGGKTPGGKTPAGERAEAAVEERPTGEHERTGDEEVFDLAGDDLEDDSLPGRTRSFPAAGAVAKTKGLAPHLVETTLEGKKGTPRTAPYASAPARAQAEEPSEAARAVAEALAARPVAPVKRLPLPAREREADAPAPAPQAPPPQARSKPVSRPLPEPLRAPAPERDLAPEPALGEPDEAEVDEEEGASLESAPTRIERGEDVGLFDQSAVREPRLVIIGGNNRGREFVLKAGDNSLGRGVDNDIVLADIAVSRKHTLVCFEGDEVILRDLGSGNGTLVNGKRAATQVLKEGDQLELGNTLLRLHYPPGGAAPFRVAGGGAAASAPSTPGAARDGERQRSAPEARRAHTTQTTPRVFNRTVLIAVAAGVAVVVVTLVVVLVVKLRHRDLTTAARTASPDELAAQHFADATRQFRARNWEQARVGYLKVLAVAPGFDQARRYADQAAAEALAQEALQRAQTALRTANFTAARQQLSRVSSSSAYAEEARSLKLRTDEQQVDKLVADGRALAAAGKKPEALAKLAEARRISPTHAKVRAALAGLGGAGAEEPAPSAATVPVARRRGDPASTRSASKVKLAVRVAPVTKVRGPSRPRVTEEEPEDGGAGSAAASGGKVKAALALYKKAQWGPAYQALKDAAQGQKGKKRSAVEALAETVRRVGQVMMRAQSALGQDPSQAVKYLQEAQLLDRKIQKGMHQGTIKAQLGRVAAAQASAALARGQYPAAYAAVKTARQAGSHDPSLGKVLKALEQRAGELVAKGLSLKGSKPGEARQLWAQVLRMVPASHAAYQKAYSLLNSSGPGHQDEDED